MKNKLLNILTLIIGVLGIWLFLDHILNFKYPEYFYNANPNINYYVGINVVSMIADLSFFTYHTLIFFSIWCILLGVSSLFKIDKLYELCVHRSIVVFIMTNYLLTTALYTIFELTSSNITFGLYALDNLAIHNFGTNILAHYIFFIYNVFLFIKIKKDKEIKNKHYQLMGVYLLIYLIYVKISGMYFYNIEWYPYPIFDLKSIIGIFGLKINVLPIIEYILLFVIFIGMSYLYICLLKLIEKLSFKINK